jgi:hypothetical protein
MRLARGERSGGAIEAQVAETEVEKVLGSRADVSQNSLGGGLVAIVGYESGEGLLETINREVGEIGDGSTFDSHGKALRPQSLPVASGADLVRQDGSQFLEGDFPGARRARLFGASQMEVPL